MMPLLFTLNIFYILPDVKYAKRRAFYWKKRLTGCKVNWFTSSLVYTPLPPPHPNIGPSNLSFICIYAQGILTKFYSDWLLSNMDIENNDFEF